MRRFVCAMFALLAAAGVDAGAARADYFVTSFGSVPAGIDGKVLRYDDSGNLLGTTIQGLTFPQGITIGPNGHLYVANNPIDDITQPAVAEVLEYDQSGNFVGSFTPPAPNTYFYDVAIGPVGTLLVSAFDLDAVLIYDLATRLYTGFALADPALLDGPDGVLYDPAVDPDGVYVASFLNDRVLRFDLTNGDVLPFVNVGASGLDGPSDINFGPDGDLYVSSNLSGDVLRFAGPNSGTNTPGDFLGVAASGGGLASPVGNIFTPGGDLLVTSNIVGDPDQLLRFDPATTPGQFLGVFASGPPLQGAAYIAYTPNVIPEPSSLALAGLGVAGVAALGLRRRSGRRG